MRLEVRRRLSHNQATLGELWVDGVFECYSLEDAVRDHKISGETAIPAGAYRVIVDWSPKFSARMPHILDVPGFLGVRIHPGNRISDTEGCILLGREIVGDTVEHSRAAFLIFFDKLELAFARGEDIDLTITNGGPS